MKGVRVLRIGGPWLVQRYFCTLRRRSHATSILVRSRERRHHIDLVGLRNRQTDTPDRTCRETPCHEFFPES